jgi:hypothetical protein
MTLPVSFTVPNTFGITRPGSAVGYENSDRFGFDCPEDVLGVNTQFIRVSTAMIIRFKKNGMTISTLL